MKFKKDVALALATMAGALVALFALFVTIPVWFEAVVITLTVVGGAMTVAEIVKAYKASYDEAIEKHTYKFPVMAFVFGTLILVAVAAIVLLSLKRLYGFALIPVGALLAILFVIALLKKLRVMKMITGLVLAILVVALVGYFTSYMVHSGVNLNPGISTETEAPETEVPETEAPNTEAPETEVPETEAPETEVPETEAPETEAPETEAPETEAPETEVPETEAPETEVPETEAPETEVPETEAPETENNEIKGEDVKPDEGDCDFVIAKINAPATMSYGNPIRITVQGINANNLKFGNEDFLSIVVISDTEVEVTLIGIVNDAGEVEFVPAAGYITVTDSVTGVNTTIEIIE